MKEFNLVKAVSREFLQVKLRDESALKHEEAALAEIESLKSLLGKKK
jgi:hypothetical protein